MGVFRMIKENNDQSFTFPHLSFQQIQHIMASYLPGHHFPPGRHHVLYQATDAEGNKAKCGFTVTVQRSGPPHSAVANTTPRSPSWGVGPAPSSNSGGSMVDGGFFNHRHHHRYNVPEKCYRPPQIRNLVAQGSILNK